jgi:hypothetical protein
MFRWLLLLLCLTLLGLGAAGMRQANERAGVTEPEAVDPQAVKEHSRRTPLESAGFKIFLAGAALVPLTALVFWLHFRRRGRLTSMTPAEVGRSTQEAEDEAARILAELETEENQDQPPPGETGASATGGG